MIKDADWTAVRAILRREYKENDLDQLMYSREFLEALKKKPRSKDDDLMQYCYIFASISRQLISRHRLDRYMQCQWFLQGLPERIVMEIFYRYDIDLEDDDSLNFDDVLEKALILVKRSKCLEDFIRDRENDLIDKHTGLEEKRPNAPNTVESFTYPAQDLTPPTQIHTMQRPVQEDIPVVRVHASRVVEVKAGEVRDEKVGQLLVDLVTILERFDDTTGFERYVHKPDSSSKRSPWKLLNSLSTGIEARKKAGMISEEEPAGFDGIVVGRGVRKSEDHG